MGSSASSQNIPIKYLNIFDLTQIGINSINISASTVTMESDKYICFQDGEQKIFIINLGDPCRPFVKQMKENYDSAIINPSGENIALKTDTMAFIYNMEVTTILKTVSLPDKVQFWKWISSDTIGMITTASVFHWNTKKSVPPKKMFDIESYMRPSESHRPKSTNYYTDPKQKWFLLGMVFTGTGVLANLLNTGFHSYQSMQLYSVEDGVSKCLNGSGATFAQIKLEGNPKQSNLLCYVEDNHRTLHIFEVGSVPVGNRPFQNKEIRSCFEFSPVALIASTKFASLYLITDSRALYYEIRLYIFDLETGKVICWTSMATSRIVSTVPENLNGGILFINRSGEVICAGIDEQKVVPYIANDVGDIDLALHLAVRHKFAGGEQLVLGLFEDHQNKYRNAVKLATRLPPTFSVSNQTMEGLEEVQKLLPQITNRTQSQLPRMPPNESAHEEAAGGIRTVNSILTIEDAVRIDQNQDLHKITLKLIDDVGVTGKLDILYGQLGLHPACLEEMKTNNPGNYVFLRAMLSEWISQKSAKATWQQLQLELRNCNLNEGANIIETLFNEAYKQEVVFTRKKLNKAD